MEWQDLINGAFETLGSPFILVSAWRLYKDKEVKGVSLLTPTFFFSWGIWNLYYYPYLDQWISFTGGILIALSNALWLYLLIFYTIKTRKRG
jgi:hypothetical protein